MQLRTPRLILQKFEENDFELYAQLAQNEAVMHYITGKVLSLKEARNNYRKHLAVNQGQVDLGVFKVLHQSDSTFVGLAKLVPLPEMGVEIGYSLLPEWWGQKIASEIVEHLLQYALSQTSHRIVTAIIDPKNEASKKILTNFHFRFLQTGSVYDLPAEYYQLELK